MKKVIALALSLVFVGSLFAQNKIKETAVPQSVLLALDKTYDSYKVKSWYQAPGQYIAEIIIDGQEGRSYFAASGDWQYSSFPVELSDCPTLMNTYYVNNYPGYRVKTIDYIEELSGDNYYRMVIIRKGVGAEDCELVFDTKGKLMRSTAPDPAIVKRDYYKYNNPDATEEEVENKAPVEHHKKTRPAPKIDKPADDTFAPSDAIAADFNKRVPPTRRNNKDAQWAQRGYDEVVAYYTNNQKVRLEAVYDANTDKFIKTGKTLDKDRYTSAILKYLAEKFNGEKYKVEKMVVYEFDSKFRGPDGKKPKPYTYVVVSQKFKGSVNKMKFTRMEFDNSGNFTGLLAQPLDEFDIQ